MIIACSTSVRSKQPLAEALHFISRSGFRSVDILAVPGWAHIDPAELVQDMAGQARTLGSLLQQTKLRPVALNAGTQFPLSASDAEERQTNLSQAQALLAFAAQVRIPVLVLQPGKAPEDTGKEEAFDRAAEMLEEIVDAASRRRVVVAIEPHSGSLAEQYDSALQFVTMVRGLKIAFDPSHFVMNNLNLNESELLLPHTVHVHLRNAAPGSLQAGVNTGSIDFISFFEKLDASGYDRAISIEYLDNHGENVNRDVLALKKMLEDRYKRI